MLCIVHERHEKHEKSLKLYRFRVGALIVMHKYFKARHSGRDCRNPEAMDGNTETDASITCGLPCKITRSHPCALDSGNPCRNDGVPQALVYKN